MRIIVFLFFFFLSGCVDSTEKTPDGLNVNIGGYIAYVREFSLQDGTHCAALVGYNKGAISCNWKQ